MEELERQAGILGETIKDNKKLAHAIVNQSWQNADFSTRLWGRMGQMRSDIGKLLEQGMIQGKNSRVLAQELRRYYIGDPALKNGRSGAKYATERLMRTELTRVQTEAQKQSFEKNGFSKYRFIVNAGCCEKCRAVASHNAGVYDLKDMMPGENAPPLHPFDRCSTAAYEDSNEYEAWLDHLEAGGTTKSWQEFKGKPIQLKRK
jgi:SPP1 gp7 family putative phage head morphogenesis protein